MGASGLVCNPGIDVTVRRSSRARRLSLRVSRLDGRVTLTLPVGVSEKEAQSFLDSRSDWVVRAVGDTLDPVMVRPGAHVLFEGQRLAIRTGTKASPMLKDQMLVVREQGAGRIVKRWLVEQARLRARARVGAYEARLGCRHTRLTLRDTRSRWGSCSSTGGIMLSWRLIMAPPQVFDYVIAHEVAHLKEMNHSPAFWSVVEFLYPDYTTPQSWLRREGHGLHRYRFD